jgi:hypothetical protein
VVFLAPMERSEHDLHYMPSRDVTAKLADEIVHKSEEISWTLNNLDAAIFLQRWVNNCP